MSTIHNIQWAIEQAQEGKEVWLPGAPHLILEKRQLVSLTGDLVYLTDDELLATDWEAGDPVVVHPYIATVKLLIVAPDYGMACDTVSELLSGAATTQVLSPEDEDAYLLDWAYTKDKDGIYTSPVYRDDIEVAPYRESPEDLAAILDREEPAE